MIELTENASLELKKMQSELEDSPSHLRLAVRGGGCSGFEYAMGFDEPEEADHTTESQGVKIVIDPHSLEYLKGCKIDFDDGLHGKGFAIDNPNVHNSCGCGKSFS